MSTVRGAATARLGVQGGAASPCPRRRREAPLGVILTSTQHATMNPL
ncbi:MAG: hypothetical protein ACLFVO_29625 [Chloroflexaceae bacterium]